MSDLKIGRRDFVAGLATAIPIAATAASDALASGVADVPIDPIFALIDAHKAAVEAERGACHHLSDMEESIPEHLRSGDVSCFEVTEVSTDDPRWSAACHRYNDATIKADEIAMRLLDEAPVTSAGVTALLTYAAQFAEAGCLFPDNFEDNLGGQRGFQYHLIAKAAAALTKVAQAGEAVQS